MPIAIINSTSVDLNKNRSTNEQVKVTGTPLAALRTIVNSSVKPPRQWGNNNSNSYRLNSMNNSTVSDQLTSKINEINKTGEDVFQVIEKISNKINQLKQNEGETISDVDMGSLDAELKKLNSCLLRGRDKLETRLDSSYDVDSLTEKARKGLNLSKNALSNIIESGYQIVTACKTLKSATSEDLLRRAATTVKNAFNRINNDYSCLQDAMLLSGIDRGVRSFQDSIERVINNTNKTTESDENITNNQLEEKLTRELLKLGDDKDNALTLLLNQQISSGAEKGKGRLFRTLMDRIFAEASHKPVCNKLSPAALQQCLLYMQEITSKNADYMINQNNTFMQLIVCAINDDSNDQNKKIAKELLDKYNTTPVIKKLINDESLVVKNNFNNYNDLIFVNKNQDHALVVNKEKASQMIFFNPQNKTSWKWHVDYTLISNQSIRVSIEKLFTEEFTVFNDSFNQHLQTSLVAKMIKALPFGEFTDKISDFILTKSKGINLDPDSQKKLAAILKANFIKTMTNGPGKPDSMLLNPEVNLKLYKDNVGIGFQKEYSKLNELPEDEQKDIKSSNEAIKLNNAVGFMTAAYIFSNLLESRIFTEDNSNYTILKDISLIFMNKAKEEKLDGEHEINIQKGIDNLSNPSIQFSSERQPGEFENNNALINVKEVLRKLKLKDSNFVQREFNL